ncbi:MAG: hypothetical protein ACTSQE_08420 [Candidatus Heimdallarchaeaceae archaeon]
MNDVIDDDIYSSRSPNYTQKALFYNEAKKKYLKMTDGAELLTYYTKKGKHPSKFNIMFVPGWSTAPYSWNDLWDELYQQFDLYVLETREKRFSRMKKHHKGDIDRHAKDVKETMDFYNLDPSRTITIGPCFGAAVTARAIAQKYVQPAGAIFISPTIEFPIPRKLIFLAYLPSYFAYNILGKPLLKLWMLLTLPKGIQRKTYFELFDNGKGSNWKKCFPLIDHNTITDYEKVNVKSWIYATQKDRLHKGGDAVTISESMLNATYVEVPNYYYMHHNHGAKEFSKMVIKNVETLAQKLEIKVTS